MAIVRMLRLRKVSSESFGRTIYIAPIKSLCGEKCRTWQQTYAEKFGLRVFEATGDSDIDSVDQLTSMDIICTTPEKLHSFTRQIASRRDFFQSIRLILLDEVHTLDVEKRGSILEITVTRLKLALSNEKGLRFIAVSASADNPQDIAQWLTVIPAEPALAYKFSENYRPVPLKVVVFGYPFNPENTSIFQFDSHLNFKLPALVSNYSNGKPTLVFCHTRSSTMSAAQTIARNMSFRLTPDQLDCIRTMMCRLTDTRLRELMLHGVAYHHAGLAAEDRKVVEEVFATGALLVLTCTSTLAMGVNLPAHLVIVKGTKLYINGQGQEYNPDEVHQMIGRAGRPQFDTEATAVIMTTTDMKDEYTNRVLGRTTIESRMYEHLREHINTEIALGGITNVQEIFLWFRATFLHVRILKKPQYYDLPAGLTVEEIERRLHDLCMIEVNELNSAGFVNIVNGCHLRTTRLGMLMCRYIMDFQTMVRMVKFTGNESLQQLIVFMSECSEFEGILLRQNDRKTLNDLMPNNRAFPSVRFPLDNHRVRTVADKINCLIQAELGTINIEDFSLQQDTIHIFRIAPRIAKCLFEYAWEENFPFSLLMNCINLQRCILARLWENSCFVTKQLPGIGNSLSTVLADAGLNTFDKILATSPQRLEAILHRNPPFGELLLSRVQLLPKYELAIIKEELPTSGSSALTFDVRIANSCHLTRVAQKRERNEEEESVLHNMVILLVGDSDNRVLLKKRMSNRQVLVEGVWKERLVLPPPVCGDQLKLVVYLLGQSTVGVDVETSLLISMGKPDSTSSTTALPRCSPSGTAISSNLVQSRLDDFHMMKTPQTANGCLSFGYHNVAAPAKVGNSDKKEASASLAQTRMTQFHPVKKPRLSLNDKSLEGTAMENAPLPSNSSSSPLPPAIASDPNQRPTSFTFRHISNSPHLPSNSPANLSLQSSVPSLSRGAQPSAMASTSKQSSILFTFQSPASSSSRDMPPPATPYTPKQRSHLFTFKASVPSPSRNTHLTVSTSTPKQSSTLVTFQSPATFSSRATHTPAPASTPKPSQTSFTFRPVPTRDHTSASTRSLPPPSPVRETLQAPNLSQELIPTEDNYSELHDTRSHFNCNQPSDTSNLGSTKSPENAHESTHLSATISINTSKLSEAWNDICSNVESSIDCEEALSYSPRSVSHVENEDKVVTPRASSPSGSIREEAFRTSELSQMPSPSLFKFKPLQPQHNARSETCDSACNRPHTRTVLSESFTESCPGPPSSRSVEIQSQGTQPLQDMSSSLLLRTLSATPALSQSSSGPSSFGVGTNPWRMETQPTLVATEVPQYMRTELSTIQRIPQPSPAPSSQMISFRCPGGMVPVAYLDYHIEMLIDQGWNEFGLYLKLEEVLGSSTCDNTIDALSTHDSEKYCPMDDENYHEEAPILRKFT